MSLIVVQHPPRCARMIVQHPPRSARHDDVEREVLPESGCGRGWQSQPRRRTSKAGNEDGQLVWLVFAADAGLARVGRERSPVGPVVRDHHAARSAADLERPAADAGSARVGRNRSSGSAPPKIIMPSEARRIFGG
jgi:hypothetical protein